MRLRFIVYERNSRIEKEYFGMFGNYVEKYLVIQESYRVSECDQRLKWYFDKFSYMSDKKINRLQRNFEVHKV